MKTYELPVLDPLKMPQVALPSMNDTHRDELELINQLGVLVDKALRGEPDEAAITVKLNEILEHTRDHFSRENQMMRDNNFPAYAVHSGEHERVLAQMESLRQEWLDNRSVEKIAHFLFVEWLDWFNQHVNSMDAVTAQFLSRVMLE